MSSDIAFCSLVRKGLIESELDMNVINWMDFININVSDMASRNKIYN